MKLSKERVKEIFRQMIAFRNYCEKYVVSLQGHIEVLEQELDSANGWIELFSQTNKGELLKENTSLKQENLQRLEEVKGLQHKVESLTEYGNKASAHLRKVREDLSKAWATIHAEREARVLMGATLERAMLDQQQVVLPKEVAEAIVWFKKQEMINEDIYDLASEEDDGLYADRIFRWVEGEGSRDLLMEALVKGYTVEQSDDDKIVDRYKECMMSGRELEASAVRQCVETLGSSQLAKRLDVVDGEMPF